MKVFRQNFLALIVLVIGSFSYATCPEKGTDCPSDACPGKNCPPGSYLKTCKDCTMDIAGTNLKLSCWCNGASTTLGSNDTFTQYPCSGNWGYKDIVVNPKTGKLSCTNKLL